MTEKDPGLAGSGRWSWFMERLRVVGGTVMINGRVDLQPLFDDKADQDWEAEQGIQSILLAEHKKGIAANDFEGQVLTAEDMVKFLGGSLCEWVNRDDIPRITSRQQELQQWVDYLPAQEAAHLFKPEQWDCVAIYLRIPHILEE